jgi:RNA polymerase sigma factor (TIGR02999 family)
MADVTAMLQALKQGDKHAAAELLPVVYDELRRLAAERLKHESPGQTLQATALVHEAYLRLVGANDDPKWDSRGHFYAAAAEAMRRILIENARRKGRQKHGGDRKRVDLGDPAAAIDQSPDRLMALDAALTKLAAADSTAAEVVKLHIFAELPLDDVAKALGMSRATAYRQWKFARAWLKCEIEENT